MFSALTHISKIRFRTQTAKYITLKNSCLCVAKYDSLNNSWGGLKRENVPGGTTGCRLQYAATQFMRNYVVSRLEHPTLSVPLLNMRWVYGNQCGALKL